MRSDAVDISIVMPAFNEGEALPDTVAQVIRHLGTRDFEVVIIDDGSSDDTWAVIERLSTQHRRVRGLRFSRNFGHQSALLAGLSAARGRAVISLDSDGQHPPEMIPELIERWREGAAVVQTLRRDQRDLGLVKRMTSRGFYRFFSWLAGTSISPGSADFRLLDRRVVDIILENPRSAMFLRGFVPWTGFRTDYIEFDPKARIAGVTKYSFRKMLGLAKQGVTRFSVKPLRLATLLGIITCGCSLGYLGYVLYTRLITGDYTTGWASVAGLLSLLGGLQLLIMGILGEYIGMIFEAQQARPPFIVADDVDGARSRPGPGAPPEE